MSNSTDQYSVVYVANIRVRGSIGGESHVRGIGTALLRRNRLNRLLLPRSAAFHQWNEAFNGRSGAFRIPPTPLGLIWFDLMVALWIVGSHVRTGRKTLMVRPHFATIFQLLVARVVRWPVAYEINGILEYENAVSGRNALLRMTYRIQDRIALRLATTVICVTAGIRNWIIENRAIHPRKALVLPNAVDAEDITECRDRLTVRSRLGVSDRHIVLGFVGTLARWQGISEVVAAALQLPADTKIRVVLVGGGPLAEEIRSVVDESHDSRILLLPPVPHNQVKDYLCAFDYGLLLRNWPEDRPLGSPLKLYEYMAAGLRILACPVDGIRDVPDADKFIRFARPDEVTGLLDTVSRETTANSEPGQLISSKELRELTLARHTWDHRAETLLGELDRRSDERTTVEDD